MKSISFFILLPSNSMHIYIMYEVPRNMVNQKNLGACVWIFYISIFKVVNKIIFYQSDLNSSNLLMVGDQGMKRKILISHHLISSWLIHTFSSPPPLLFSLSHSFPTSLTCSLAGWVNHHWFFICLLLPITTSCFILLYVCPPHSWVFQYHDL